MRKYLLPLIICTLCLAALLLFCSRLVMPKYATESREGNLVAEYYRAADADERHDVIFFGDCEAYSSFAPPILYEKYGISSFVRASPAQTAAQSYYLICETLEYEKPQAIVLSVYSLCRTDIQREAYNRMTLDGMRMSPQKLLAIKDSAGDDESFISYIFPLLRFHSRIYTLSGEDFEYLFTRPHVSHNGSFLEKGVCAAEGEFNTDTPYTPLPTQNLEYLRKITAVCQENGVELILVKTPISSWRYPWSDEWDKEISDYAAKNGIAYYNLIKESEKIGIDMTTDTYDGGFHLNVYCAEKTTIYFGEILSKSYGIIGTENEIWEKKIEEYYRERNDEIQ